MIDCRRRRAGPAGSTVAGPVITLVNVRSTTQVLRGDMELGLLKAAYGDFEIETVAFTLEHGGPLSWQLSEEQKRKILGSWEEENNQRALVRLKSFFLQNGE